MWEEEVGPLSPRRRSRALALQVLFEVEATGHDPGKSLEWLLQERQSAVAPATVAFARTLIQGVLAHKEELDPLIRQHAPHWPIGQLSPVDRNLLRLALYELLIDRQAPPRAVINEAVELAKLFGSDSSPRFVNGVLGSIMEAARS